MKTITKLMLTAMLLVVGVVGVNAKKYYADFGTAVAVGNATWMAETNTFAWTAGSYAYMVVPGGSFSGDLSGYTAIGLTVSGLENEFRVDILANGKTFTGKSITADGNIVLDIFNDFNKQWASDKITVEDLKSVTAVRLNTNSASGSAVVTKFFIAKPAVFSYDDSGNAEIDFSDLVATGGLSFNEETGELNNDGTGGTLYVNMPTDGIDFTNMTAMTVNKSGDDVIDHLEIRDTKNSISNGFWGSKYGVNFTSGDAMKFNNAPNVNSIVWTGNATAGTLTISSIVFKANVITCALPGAPVVLNTLQYHNFVGGTNATAAWNINTATDTYYGSGSSDASNYVDLTGYEELRIHRENNTGFRAFFINAAGTGTNNINNNTTGTVSWNETEKYWVIDLSKVEKYDNKIYLNTIKSESWGVKNVVTNITLYKTPVNAPNYILAGNGAYTLGAATALADANATYIDATGITAATALVSANPNCLIAANAGMVTNENNVIVSGDCAQLALTDKKPFKAPVAFTATAAPTYDRAFAATQTATVCLPFSLTSEEAEAFGQFYELSGFDGSTLRFTSVDAPEANTAYLVVPKSTTLALTEAGKSIDATPADLDTNVDDMEFIGTMSATSIPASSTGTGDSDYSYYAYNDGSLVKIVTKAATLPAFRAYFKVKNSSVSAARSLSISFDGNDVTGINATVGDTKNVNEVYDLQGRRVVNPAKGLYIVNGKKVIK